jgi:hypothetical protein
VGPDNRREFELALRELDLRRREEALRRVEQATALPRVPAGYFKPARTNEQTWWEKQLGEY